MKIILEFSKNVTIEINVSGVYNRINKLEKRLPWIYRTKRGGTIYEKKGRDTYGSFAYSSDDVRASGRVPNRRNGFGRK